MKKIFVLIFLIYNCWVFSQNQYPKLSYSISYNNQHVSMENYNNYLDNITSDLIKIDQRLKRVNKYDIRFQIEPNKWYSIGLYLEYSTGKLSFNPSFKILNPDLSVTLVEGFSKNRITSTNIGLSGSLFLNSIVESKSTFIRNLNYGVNIEMGYGFVEYLSETYNPSFSEYSVTSFIRNGNGLRLNTGVFIEYPLTKKPFEILVGFISGYQYYKTFVLKGPEGIEWGDPEYYVTPGLINLNFSGISLGAYFKIRK